MPAPDQWCRGDIGTPHDFVMTRDTNAPECQPLRSWVRTLWEGNSHTGAGVQRSLDEDWECFHVEFCQRCRRKIRSVVGKADCPDANTSAPQGG